MGSRGKQRNRAGKNRKRASANVNIHTHTHKLWYPPQRCHSSFHSAVDSCCHSAVRGAVAAQNAGLPLKLISIVSFDFKPNSIKNSSIEPHSVNSALRGLRGRDLERSCHSAAEVVNGCGSAVGDTRELHQPGITPLTIQSTSIGDNRTHYPEAPADR